MKSLFCLANLCGLVSLLEELAFSAMSIAPGAEHLQRIMMITTGGFCIFWFSLAFWLRARMRNAPSFPPPPWLRRLLMGASHVYLLSVFLLLGGCAMPRVRDTPPAPGSFDAFMADRPAAARLLRHHPALEQWMRAEWNRPIGDYRVRWDDHPPTTSPIAENTSTTQAHLTAIRVSKNSLPWTS